jgi:UDP-glucose 4-epimerase
VKLGVTGGAGFIGSNIVKLLVKQNHDVTVIDNLYRGKLENLKEVEEKITFSKTDILEYDKLKNEMKNLDGVFHEAALTSVPESFTKTDEYNRVNIVGTENVFKIANELNFKVIYASSSSIYGNPKGIPINETFERKPINPYGVTKLEDELLAEKYHNLGSKIIGLRYFNVYGKCQNLDYAGVITKFLDRLKLNQSPIIFGDGKQVRDFIFVGDVAQANLKAFESKTDFGFFNVGTGIGTTINQLVKLMIKMYGSNREPIYESLPDGDVEESQSDLSLIKNKISWSPETNLENGLKTIF